MVEWRRQPNVDVFPEERQARRPIELDEAKASGGRCWVVVVGQDAATRPAAGEAAVERAVIAWIDDEVADAMPSCTVQKGILGFQARKHVGHRRVLVLDRGVVVIHRPGEGKEVGASAVLCSVGRCLEQIDHCIHSTIVAASPGCRWFRVPEEARAHAHAPCLHRELFRHELAASRTSKRRHNLERATTTKRRASHQPRPAVTFYIGVHVTAMRTQVQTRIYPVGDR